MDLAALRAAGPRVATITLASISAWMLFLLGLLGPLTPSYGRPSPGILLLFVGGPVVLVALASWLARGLVMRGLLLVQAVIMAATTVWLPWS